MVLQVLLNILNIVYWRYRVLQVQSTGGASYSRCGVLEVLGIPGISYRRCRVVILSVCVLHGVLHCLGYSCVVLCCTLTAGDCDVALLSA